MCIDKTGEPCFILHIRIPDRFFVLAGEKEEKETALNPHKVEVFCYCPLLQGGNPMGILEIP